ncbi:MAG: glutamate transport system permease protein [Streptomyces sp.]|jgi:glutamate transport system permease protein|nr:glutamate transport system permease protein [Streptomyces sp.]
MSANVLFDAPGPRARTRNNIIGAVASLAILAVLYFVYRQLDAKGQFAGYLWQPFQYSQIQQRLAEGLLATLKAFALAAVFSLALGAVLAAGRLSDHAPLRWVASAVVEFFRAMPLLIMIFALYIGVFTSTPLWALVIGLTLYNGSVQAEIFRAGINAVPRGQSEAAYAIGLRKTQVMVFVLLPQAVRAMLPSIISQLVVTLKDTSLGFIITYEELLNNGRLIAATSLGFPYVPLVMIIAPIYILMCLALSSLATWIERRGRRSPKGAPPAAPKAKAVEAAAE